MKTRGIHIVLLALTMMLPFVSGCKKTGNPLDEDGLPHATQRGAMVFACKINGENWVSSRKSRDLKASVGDESIGILGTTYLSRGFQSFEIRIKHPNDGVSFRLDNSQECFVVFTTDNINCFDTVNEYGLGDSQSTDGEMVFTRIDHEKKIVSGTFWFDIPTDKCGILKVTHGRFDIRYY